MIKEYIEKIAAGNNLSIEDSFKVMSHIMNGECNNSLIAGLLLALRTKGETPEEVAGFVKAMREKSVKIKSSSDNTIDVCGTGGDGSNTFNISTASAFVVAGNPNASELYTVCKPGGVMASYTSEAELNLLYRWIYAGAKNN